MLTRSMITTALGVALGAITVGGVGLAFGSGSSLGSLHSSRGSADGPCEMVAEAAKRACREAALEDWWIKRGNCFNIANPAQRAQCLSEAWTELQSARELCDDQSDAREDLCDLLGGGYYDPQIVPSNFVSVITNPFMPLTPGKTFIYEKATAAGLERIEFAVTRQTESILGVPCTVVHDTVRLNNEIQEQTTDWFAQDVQGNVWYFGELTFEYENGAPVNMAGTWKAGVNFAKPGIVMHAVSQVGRTYRQEFFLGEAEDAATVLSLSATATVPYGSFTNCRKTRDFTPIEPGHAEHKFFAAGVGQVLTVNTETGARSQLVQIIIN